MATKSLQTMVTYRFQTGTLQMFHGRKSYRLSNSWHDAIDQIRIACDANHETFDASRIVTVPDSVHSIKRHPEPTTETGYAFEFTGADWQRSSDERWDTVVHTATDSDRFVGVRRIDGYPVNVWQSGKIHVAQTRHQV